MATIVCPTCDSPLRILKACGCQDYWCNECKKLISKKILFPVKSDRKPEEKE